jgi:MoxR-like ATPase
LTKTIWESATPKTQSALLEAIAEEQITIEGVSRPLPLPFMVVATQNPAEHHGIYPLPGSQLDRFMKRPDRKRDAYAPVLCLVRA